MVPVKNLEELSTGRKTVRKISVPTLIVYGFHQVAFTHVFMVTSRVSVPIRMWFSIEG